MPRKNHKMVDGRLLKTDKSFSDLKMSQREKIAGWLYLELIRMNEIARIKNEVRLKQWTEMVRQRNESGLNVSQWCRQNGINQKTYYYRLNRVRKALCGEVEKHEIVPVSTEPEIAVSHEQISLSVGNVVVNLPDDFNEDTLKRLLGVLR